ncbi:hypothetical protein Plhal304r1_c044g0125161 [Plasmopara halstedii]
MYHYRSDIQPSRHHRPRKLRRDRVLYSVSGRFSGSANLQFGFDCPRPWPCNPNSRAQI